MTEDQIEKEREEMYEKLLTLLMENIHSQFDFSKVDCEKTASFADDLHYANLESKRCAETIEH